MLVFKPCENFLLLPPPPTTNSKPHRPNHLDVKLLLHFPSSSSLKPHFIKSILSSSSPAAAAPPPSEDVDFLMDSGGLSYDQAIQVIREKPTLLQDGGGRKPRSVIAYFESIGFSKTHISKLIFKYPRFLVADVERTLKPKIQMFQDFGFSNSDIAELIATRPYILTRGLKTHIKPALDLIKSIVKTDDDLIKIIKRSGRFLLGSSRCRKSIEPKIDVLRQHGVPDSEISHLVLSRLDNLMLTPKVFKSIVERIVSLGFKPETRMFSIAVYAMCTMSKPTWDSKIDLLKGLGWSDEQILDSFRKSPSFLTLSRENLKESIEFFCKEESLNWDASFLSQHPDVLCYSLKTRVIPRYAVLKCLMSKEIIKQNTRFITMLKLNETLFLSRYIFKYQDQLPHLYEVYEKECMLGGCKEEENGDIDMTV